MTRPVPKEKPSRENPAKAFCARFYSPPSSVKDSSVALPMP